jgi:hypothetical protein
MSDTWNIRPSLIVLSLAAVVAVSVAAYGLRHADAVSGDAVVMEAVCRQLLDNTTVGRQGLVSSVWWPPLPVLLRLPLAALPLAGTDIPIASLLVGAAFGVAVLVLLEGILRSWSVGGVRFLLVAALALHPAFLRVCVDGSSVTSALFLVLLSAYGLVQWAGSKQARFLVYYGLGTSLLVLTEAATAPWLLLLAVLLVLEQLVERSPRARMEAVLVLGFLPALYTAGLWVLMNWLIMGDGIYFLRSAWQSPAIRIPGPPLRTDRAGGPVLLCLAALLLAAVRRDRRGGYLSLVAMAPAALAPALAARGVPWGADLLVLLLFPLSVLAVGYTVSLVSRVSGRVGWLLWLLPAAITVSAWLGPGAGRTAGQAQGRYGRILADRGRWLSRIEHQVTSRTPYAKVFVCGYEGFKLLGTRHSEVFTHSLDFNFEQARKDYYGHDLFVLVHRPVDRGGMDSVHWQYEQIYELGHRYTLYDGTWGNWRLFEIIQAPRRQRKEPATR